MIRGSASAIAPRKGSVGFALFWSTPWRACEERPWFGAPPFFAPHLGRFLGPERGDWLMATWRVIRNGKEHGPFTDEQLKKLSESGKLKREDLLRPEDSRHTVQAGTLNDLFPPLDVNPTAVEKTIAFPKFDREKIKKAGIWFVCLIFASSMMKSCSGSRTTGGLRTEEDVNELSLVGKSQEETMNLLGKPTYIHPSGRFRDGTTYFESWKYERAIKHPVTGSARDLQIFFDRSREAIGWDIK
jgi:hypothetical protein